MGKGEKPILSVRIDQTLMDRLDRLVEETGSGRAEIIERCMIVGLEDQEELVKWLKSPVQGPVAALMMHPAVINTILRITGQSRTHVVDEAQQEMVKRMRQKSRGRGTKTRPATS